MIKTTTNTYDYIIVGGGAAGCVLANRLSNNENQVCVIEAGPKDTNPFIRMPLGILLVLRSKILNWHFWTVPQKNCVNRSIYWPRGKTLGGSSAINAMCYVRGNAKDYDEWAKLGNEGWSYKDVLPYFIKLEHFEGKLDHYHGKQGFLNVTTPVYRNPLMKVFIAAAKQAGYPEVRDYNAATQEGVGYFYVTQKNGQRCSNAHGYLRIAENRSNLTIITEAHATKILFDKKRAIGISYQKKGKTFDIFSARGVILAAGAIGSPQLLLLSGIGPRAHIEKHGIKVIHDLPGVGENLQDHLDIHITCLEKTKHSLSFRPSSFFRILFDCFKYFFYSRGELTSNYTQATGFTKSKPEMVLPDLQWHFAASMYTNSAMEVKPLFKYHGYTLMTCHLHPRSRGRIQLQSADPLNDPLIDPNYLSVASDLEALVIGFKKAREILNQSAFKPYFLNEYEPGPAVETDEQIRNYIRSRAETIYHPIGTCKMGKDNMAVVDPKHLKVYGVENLYVIDASIMPTLTSGNTLAPTTMIAERGAEMILRNHNSK